MKWYSNKALDVREGKVKLETDENNVDYGTQFLVKLLHSLLVLALN